MKTIVVAMISVFLLFYSPFAAAQQTAAASANNAVVPPLVKFSGTLSDLNGKPLSGVVGVTFALYKDQQGGAPLWLETQNVHLDQSGHYSVMLGSTSSTGLPAEIFLGGEARWLGIQAQSQAEQPRVLLLSVPYALKAGDAQTLGGLPSSAFVRAAPPAVGSSVTLGRTTWSGSTPSGAMPPASLDVTTTGGTVNTLPLFSTSTNIQNSILTQTGTSAINLAGKMIFPSNGTATASKGADSQPEVFIGSAFNSTSSAAVNQKFQLQVEPANNDTAAPSSTLNLLYASGTAAPAETGLHIASSGQITFATGQTFPGTGHGTITGVTAGTDLVGGGTTGAIALNLDTTKVPQLAAANTFTGNQTVNGNLSATGVVTGSSYQIGSYLFGFGAPGNGNAFLGFAGNAAMTGINNTGVGFNALAANITGSANTASGYEALDSNVTGSNNTANGFEALSSNTGSNNTAVGERTLFHNTTGASNTATGQHALEGNTTANDNTADGYEALQANGGQQNTAVGSHALYNNTGVTYNSQGSYNTAAGYEALYSNTNGGLNTAVGVQALYSNIGDVNANGWYNVAIGQTSLQANTTGSENTAVGTGSLIENKTGNENTCVGAYCGAGADGLTNATAIGAHAVVSASNSLVLGGSGKYAVKVGIGTEAPSNVLTIAQGLGHPVSDGWETFSSRRWKTNIEPLQNALAKVEQLRGVSYDLKNSGKHEIGVIAEEVGAVVPEVVSYEENKKDARSVDYSRLTALLIEATKEQQREFQQQQAELTNALRQIKRQQALLRAQSTAMRDLKAEIRETRETVRNLKAQGTAQQPALVAAK